MVKRTLSSTEGFSLKILNYNDFKKGKLNLATNTKISLRCTRIEIICPDTNSISKQFPDILLLIFREMGQAVE